MEKSSAKALVILGVVLVAIVGAGWFALSSVTGEGTPRYTQVDNACVHDSGDSDMPFEYTLTAYDEGGRSEEVTFKTTRELRDGAYLMLRVLPIRGVVSWEEVQPENMPQACQDALGV